MLHPDLYSSWDWYILFGELEVDRVHQLRMFRHALLLKDFSAR